ncbi:hypothetical protein WP1_296 [Pseudomonas phage WP1]
MDPISDSRSSKPLKVATAFISILLLESSFQWADYTP